MHSPCNLPFSFASHIWFVCNEKGAISRWELLFRVNKNKDWGHLHLNYFKPFSGIEIIPFCNIFLWSGKLIGVVEGELAEKMIGFIKQSRKNYKYLKIYSLTGSNSNTYAQWVLNQFPEVNIKLPWNSFGKDYK